MDDELVKNLKAVNLIVDMAIHTVQSDYQNIGNLIGEYEESSGHMPEDLMTFDDFYNLSQTMNLEIIKIFSKAMKKALSFAVAENLLTLMDNEEDEL